MLDKNTHVYCTHCKWFRLDEEEIPYCFFENECDINNPKSDLTYDKRPKYEKRKNKF